MNKRLGAAIVIVASGIIIGVLGVLGLYLWNLLGCDVGGSSPGECLGTVYVMLLFGGAFIGVIAVLGVYPRLRKRNRPIA